jgi:hypothetical protein
VEGGPPAPPPKPAGGDASRAPAGPVEGQGGVPEPSEGLPVPQVGGSVWGRPLSPVHPLARKLLQSSSRISNFPLGGSHDLWQRLTSSAVKSDVAAVFVGRIRQVWGGGGGDLFVTHCYLQGPESFASYTPHYFLLK